MCNIAVIDAHNHLHRYHHAIPEEKGLVEPWGKMVASLIRSLHLHGAIAVFDPLEKEPKPGRPETPDRIKRDQPKIQSLCEAIGIKVVVPSALNEEADQLIADVCNHLAGKEDIFIVSSDKDLAQLVGRTGEFYTYLVRPEDGAWKIYDEWRIFDKYGVTPAQISDYLMLVGDPSDGISGVRGIGEKTAAALLKRYGSLDDLLLKSSGLSMDEFIERYNTKQEIVLKKIEGLSERLADNLCHDIRHLPSRREMTQLTPRRLHEFSHVQKPNVVEAVKILCHVGLSEMAAKVMENKLWNK